MANVNLVKKRNVKSVVWTYLGLKADEWQTFCRGEAHAGVQDVQEGCDVQRRRYDKPIHPSSRCSSQSVQGGIKRGREFEGKREDTLPTYTCCCDFKNYAVQSKVCISTQVELHSRVQSCKDMQPYFTVEQEGFKRLVHKLNPQYSLPSQKCTWTCHWKRHTVTHFCGVKLIASPSRLYTRHKCTIGASLQCRGYHCGPFSQPPNTRSREHTGISSKKLGVTLKHSLSSHLYCFTIDSVLY